MADLTTTYMGIKLNNPIIVGSCTLSNMIDNIKKAEDAGAGALVIRSLFEEQVMYKNEALQEALNVGADAFPEALDYFPPMDTDSAEKHIYWVEETRKHVSMPLIGSVNAVTPGVCTEYARRLAETGINGLELNLYDVAADLDQTGEQVEQRLLETFESVRDAVDIPVAVKLSPYFASVGNIVKELDERGARGVVLFNRFIQPDIDIENEKLSLQMPMSSREEIRLPLRWVTLVYAKVGVDLCGTTGIQSAEDIIKFILGGATTVQTASHLYRNGIESISVLIQDLKKWMDEHGYSMIEDFRGKVSQLGLPGNARRFERAQYMKIIDSYTG